MSDLFKELTENCKVIYDDDSFAYLKFKDIKKLLTETEKLDREDAFKMTFNNAGLKIVAAGYESPLKDVVVCYTDEYERGFDFLLNKNDSILLAKVLGVTGEDLQVKDIKG